MKSTYLATVKKDFKLTDAFKEKLKKKDIELLGYHKNLNILKLASEKDLLKLKMPKNITSIEKDREVSALDNRAMDNKVDENLPEKKRRSHDSE